MNEPTASVFYNATLETLPRLQQQANESVAAMHLLLPCSETLLNVCPLHS